MEFMTAGVSKCRLIFSFCVFLRCVRVGNSWVEYLVFDWNCSILAIMTSMETFEFC